MYKIINYLKRDKIPYINDIQTVKTIAEMSHLNNARFRPIAQNSKVNKYTVEPITLLWLREVG